jgi:hypothetical protein
MMELMAGPLRSTSAIRRRYFLMVDKAVSLPDVIASCSWATVASSHSNDLMRNGVVDESDAAEISSERETVVSSFNSGICNFYSAGAIYTS